MKSRIFSLLLVVVLVLGIAPLAGAQGDFECYNLSAEDCAILAGATENMNMATSFYQNFAIDFSLGGIGMLAMMADPGATDAPAGDITFNVVGEGPFAFDAAMMTAEDPFAGLVMAMTMDASAFDGSEEISGTQAFTIVDGVIYISDAASGETIGIPLNAMIEGGLGSVMGMPMPGEALSPDALATGDMSALLDSFGLGSLAGLEGMEGMELDVTPYVNFERLADEEMMGQAMIPFSFTLDGTGLLNSPEFSQMVGGLVTALSEEDPSVASLGMMVPMLASGLTAEVNVTQWVGADDNFIHRLSFDVNGALDLGMLVPPSEDAPELPPISLDLHFEVDLSGINEAQDVTAPEGATMLTEEQIQEMFGAMGGF